MQKLKIFSLCLLVLIVLPTPSIATSEDDRLLEILEERLEKGVQTREKNNLIKEMGQEVKNYESELEVIDENIRAISEELEKISSDINRHMLIVNYLERREAVVHYALFKKHRPIIVKLTNAEEINAYLQEYMEIPGLKDDRNDVLGGLEKDYKGYYALLQDQKEQREERVSRINSLIAQETHIHEALGELEDADTILKNQEDAIKNEIIREKERKEAIANASKPSTAPSSSAAAATTHNKDYMPEVTNAGFMRPATGTMSSPYGPRATFGGRMHHGIDIGKNGRTGNVPIVSVQDGTVVRSYYSDSYGNTVIIAHSVNGKLVTTLYAHLENRAVSDGQEVSKGQFLGNMGNTGRSFGPHLHFEVHEGGWNVGKTNAVDPLKYIPR
ncbi:peptidoglycan DD-metalloendopeptidase family protein (plasmid) [Alkalihalophilus sp. As8PL]|uniref:Peptidoglycan DD-metalloendopeptidase family protein n=1 Tax=Alkalihalophilus sp. As8PL TaxID=3237103 RepID=A0AB39BMW7_9BACI